MATQTLVPSKVQESSSSTVSQRAAGMARIRSKVGLA
jgi:hypothetical protein